jgi:hypothetical protein
MQLRLQLLVTAYKEHMAETTGQRCLRGYSHAPNLVNVAERTKAVTVDDTVSPWLCVAAVVRCTSIA